MTAALRELNAAAERQERKKPGTPFAERLFRFNWLLLALGLAVSGIGLFNLYVVGVTTGDGWSSFAQGHAQRLMVGFAAFLIVSLLDIRFLRFMAFLGALSALGLLVYVHFFGVSYNTVAQRWMDLGPISLQPSEIAQVALIVFLAAYWDGRSYRQMGNPLWLIPPLVLIAIAAYLIYEQPDLGTTLKLLMLMGLMTFCAGVRWWLALLVLALIIGAVWFIVRAPEQYLKPYQVDRVTCFTLTEDEIAARGGETACDQPRQARIAIGGAGIWGHGVLEAPQVKSLIIYEPYNDMILAVHAEQFGLVGTVGLLMLVAAVVLLGFFVALVAKNQFCRLLAMGAAINFGLYATINVMMVLSLLPVVGMPFALMSQGGTVTVFTWVGLGLINNAWINRNLILSPHDAVDER